METYILIAAMVLVNTALAAYNSYKLAGLEGALAMLGLCTVIVVSTFGRSVVEGRRR